MQLCRRSKGRPEDAAALNAAILPVDIAGVEWGVAIVDALADEFTHDYDNDDDGIIAVEDLPPPREHDNEIEVLDNNDDSNAETSDNDDDDDDSNAETSDDDESVDNEDEDEDDNDDNDGTDATGLRRSQRANRGRTKRYENYAVLLHAR